MAAKTKDEAQEVLDKVDHGKELTAAEQRAYDAMVAQAEEDAGYVSASWSGRPGFRPINGGDLWFENERDVQAHVARSRVHANLTGGVGA